MQISDLFKKAIKDTFYDKKIEIWEAGKIRDDEGATIESGKTKMVDEFMGNFQFSTREKIQQEYGQEIQASAIVTCESTIAKEGDILVYNAKEYVIKAVIPSDSHITILVQGSDTNG